MCVRARGVLGAVHVRVPGAAVRAGRRPTVGRRARSPFVVVACSGALPCAFHCGESTEVLRSTGAGPCGPRGRGQADASAERGGRTHPRREADASAEEKADASASGGQRADASAAGGPRGMASYWPEERRADASARGPRGRRAWFRRPALSLRRAGLARASCFRRAGSALSFRSRCSLRG